LFYGLLVGECACTAERTEVQRAVICTGWFAKDEELYEEEDQESNGKLAEEEALREGEAVGC
jgi:hypothetical protein